MDYKCLIVDDEEMICRSTCEYFNIFDLPSTHVTSYEAAVSFLEKPSIDHNLRYQFRKKIWV